MIETKKLPRILPLPLSSHEQVLLWSFVRSLSSSFPPLLPLPVIPFMSMSSYPSSALCRVPWCPHPLAPPIHPASSCSQQWWWVLVRGGVLVAGSSLVIAGRQVGRCGCVGWVVVSLFGPETWYVGAVRLGVASLHHCM